MKPSVVASNRDKVGRLESVAGPDRSERIEAEITAVLRDIDAHYMRAVQLVTRLQQAVHGYVGQVRGVHVAVRDVRDRLERIQERREWVTGVGRRCWEGDASRDEEDVLKAGAANGRRASVSDSRSDSEIPSLSVSVGEWAGSGDGIDTSVLPETPTFRNLSLSPPRTPSIGRPRSAKSRQNAVGALNSREEEEEEEAVSASAPDASTMEEEVDGSGAPPCVPLPTWISAAPTESTAPPELVDLSRFPRCFQSGEGAAQLARVYAQWRARPRRPLSLPELCQMLGGDLDAESVELCCGLLQSRGYLRAVASADVDADAVYQAR